VIGRAKDGLDRSLSLEPRIAGVLTSAITPDLISDTTSYKPTLFPALSDMWSNSTMQRLEMPILTPGGFT
jgi:hypothetical protein